jgi:hypothetical protein
MRKYSKTEDVTFAIVRNCSLWKLVDLGGHVCSCAASVQMVRFFYIKWESKIDDGGLHSVKINDDILWLDVSMNDILSMALTQSITNSRYNFFDIFLLQSTAIMDDGL